MVFMTVPRLELPNKTLELTVWDYDRFKPSIFLGEVTLNLSGKVVLPGLLLSVQVT